MFKKTKLYVGVSLLVQAVCSVVMFFILLGKKKSVAGAFLALAAISGAAGGYLLYDCKQEEELSFGCVGCDDEDCDCCEFGCDDDFDGDLFAREDDEMEVEIVEEDENKTVAE